jgi:hypothetical protein
VSSRRRALMRDSPQMECTEKGMSCVPWVRGIASVILFTNKARKSEVWWSGLIYCANDWRDAGAPSAGEDVCSYVL